MIDKSLRRERLTVEDVAEQARASQIGSLEEVAWAVYEPSWSMLHPQAVAS